MVQFGFESTGISKDDILNENKIIQLGVSPIKIDILNSIDGVGFEDAYPRIKRVNFGNSVANFISYEDLIKKNPAQIEKKIKLI